MATNKQEAQRKSMETLADLIGMGVKEVYKMFLRNVVAQGLILLMIALLLVGAGVLIAMGVVVPIWTWILCGIALIPLIWGVLLISNPAYHALEDIIDRIKK